jgi:hypothetical protein
VFHASLLSPYHETINFGPNFSRPPPDLIGGEEEYEVERILSHRRHGRSRKLQYFIKWKGYPESDNTWEPVEQVHVSDLIKAYHRSNPLEHKRGRGAAMNGIILPSHSSPVRTIQLPCLLKNPPTPALEMTTSPGLSQSLTISGCVTHPKKERYRTVGFRWHVPA